MKRLPVALALLLFSVGAAGFAVSDADRPTEEITFHWDDGAWTPTSRMVFSYGRAAGEPTTVLNQSWVDGGWTDVSKDEWTLDAAGRQTTGVTYVWVDSASISGASTSGAWAEQMDMAFYYDADGNKVAARRRSLGDGGPTNADSLASMFEGGREMERRFFRWQDGAWHEVLSQTSAYDDEGRETVRVHLTHGPDGWTEQRRWTFTYDDEGRRSASAVAVMEDGTWTPWLNQTYAHDPDGRLTTVVHEEWDGSGWTSMMKNETRYGTDR